MSNTFPDVSYIKTSIKNASGILDSIDSDIKECKKLISMKKLTVEVNEDSMILLKKMNTNLQNQLKKKDEELEGMKSTLSKKLLEVEKLKEKKRKNDEDEAEAEDYKSKYYTISSELERLQEHANKINVRIY